jgi:hypothetical protein
MTGGVVGHPARKASANIRHSQHTGEKLAKLENAACGALRHFMLRRTGWEQLRVSMSHKVRTRSGWGQDICIIVTEHAQPLAGRRQRPAVETAVVKRLPAANLSLGDTAFDPDPLEHR